MKKAITTAAAAVWAVSAASAGVTTAFDFASAYVFRGETLNDGLVFQPGIEAEGLGLPEAWGTVTVGAWANYDIGDYNETLTANEFSEVDLYVSYSLPPLAEGLDLFVGYTEYTYPGAVGDNGESVGSDKEANAGVGYSLSGLDIYYTAYFALGDEVDNDIYNEVTARYGLELSDALTVGVFGSVGYMMFDDDSNDDGLHNGTVGADISFALTEVWSIRASLTYITQLDDELLVDVDDGGTYDVSLVGMLGVSASF